MDGVRRKTWWVGTTRGRCCFNCNEHWCPRPVMFFVRFCKTDSPDPSHHFAPETQGNSRTGPPHHTGIRIYLHNKEYIKMKHYKTRGVENQRIGMHWPSTHLMCTRHPNMPWQLGSTGTATIVWRYWPSTWCQKLEYDRNIFLQDKGGIPVTPHCMTSVVKLDFWESSALILMTRKDAPFDASRKDLWRWGSRHFQDTSLKKVH